MDSEKITVPGEHSGQITEFNVIRLKSVSSTNDFLKDLAEKNYPDGTVVCTDHQTSGRGRNGRIWYDPAGKGLTFSILSRPQISVQQALIYSFIPAVVLARFLRDEYDVPAYVKWPNDITVAGKKLCGILCETVSVAGLVKYMVVGFGINILQEISDFPLDLQNNAVSLAILQKKHFDKQIFLCKFLIRYAQFLKLSAHWENEIADNWNSLCCHYNSRVTVLTSKNQIDGIFRGISETGTAVIETENKIIKLVNIDEFSLR